MRREGYDLALPDLDTTENPYGRVFLTIERGSRVLDVGCDTGRFGKELRARKDCIVDGIEMCAGCIEKAASNLDRVFERRVTGASSFEGLEGYDVVLFMNVLEHLEDPWEVIGGARKVLKPGGSVKVVVPNVAHVSILRRLLAGRFDYTETGSMDRNHLRWFTRKSLGETLKDSGYKEVSVEGVAMVPRMPFSFVAKGLARLFPDLFSGACIGTGQNPGVGLL